MRAFRQRYNGEKKNILTIKFMGQFSLCQQWQSTFASNLYRLLWYQIRNCTWTLCLLIDKIFIFYFVVCSVLWNSTPINIHKLFIMISVRWISMVPSDERQWQKKHRKNLQFHIYLSASTLVLYVIIVAVFVKPVVCSIHNILLDYYFAFMSNRTVVIGQLMQGRKWTNYRIETRLCPKHRCYVRWMWVCVCLWTTAVIVCVLIDYYFLWCSLDVTRLLNSITNRQQILWAHTQQQHKNEPAFVQCTIECGLCCVNVSESSFFFLVFLQLLFSCQLWCDK